jgi:hypothetical protein
MKTELVIRESRHTEKGNYITITLNGKTYYASIDED